MGYLKTMNEAKQLLADREPFTTGTLSARYDTAGNYLVFSYDAMIAGYHNTGRVDYNSTYYSNTTSKHLNMVKKAWAINPATEADKISRLLGGMLDNLKGVN